MFGLIGGKRKNKVVVANNPVSWRRQLSALGLLVTHELEGTPLDDPLLTGYLDQLRDDGYLVEFRIGCHLSWDHLMAALEQPGYEGLPQALALPPVTTLRPALCSRDSLSDRSFSISLAGWVDEGGRTRIADMTGPIVSLGDRSERMNAAQWQLVRAIIEFAQRPASQHTDQVHREAWGRIRQLALAADARLDDFLSRSVVLTPEKLDLQMRRSAVLKKENVIEIVPGFAQAPADWLDRFDCNPAVLDRYDLPTQEGIVQVLITPAVKTVLQEIKRFPARRVAGVRAQAFMLNPYAALGAHAHAVIDEQQFEHAREAAGLRHERFSPVIDRDDSGYPVSVGLSIESTTSASHSAASELVPLSDDALAVFVARLARALAHGHLLLGWEGYDLELQSEAQMHLAELKDALAARTQPRLLILYAQVHDLSAYSARVEGIGTEKPYYSPYIAKKKEADGWFPDNVQPIISFTPPGQAEPVAIPATKAVIQQIQRGIEAAQASGATTLTLPGLPVPMALSEARSILEAIEAVTGEIEAGQPPKPPTAPVPKKPVADGKTLLLRPNIDTLDHDESRRQTLQTQPAAPDVPTRFTPGTALLAHQREGLAWLQHLHRLRASHQVRGAVLADDMGLGKTLQLLSFMVRLHEQQPHGGPMLVVAPVSLLENWKDELDKFFQPGTLPVLTAYGDALKTLRVPREAIDERLRTEDGLVRFLRPNWIGAARLVLTTYETLRDLEFSFSAQRWSVMVCDEAQRIKNPAAMVTRAAKKQNADFRIACTGTPVENTLADLWCLFDFIQPGLLGTLNAFGRRYRKPIEARTDEEQARVEELRARIAPQILRRTKAEVAKDLPRKQGDTACTPPHVRIVAASIEPEEGAKKRRRRGAIRQGIQGPGGGQAAAAGECPGGAGVRGGGREGRDAGEVACPGAGIGERRRRASAPGVDGGSPAAGGDCDGLAGRDGEVGVVPRAGGVSAGADAVERECAGCAGRAEGGERRRRQWCAAPASQGAGARAEAQGPCAGGGGGTAGAVKKTLGDLPGGRGRMTVQEDRQKMMGHIEVACREGARLKPACEMAGLDVRTLQRWRARAGAGDGRPGAVRPMPAHALSADERARLLEVANEARFADMPPARIVPMLADEGVYLASESSFSRVLRAAGQSRHRGRARAPRPGKAPTTHVARAPGEVWCWDMTYLPCEVSGRWFFLYLILDLYSRRVVGFEVHDSDSADHAVALLKRAALAEGLHGRPPEQRPVLHGDNGATLKATTVLAMLHWLKIRPSYSRPRVSDDNAFVESLFRTAKYRPEFPASGGFKDLQAARQWASDFVHWYNHDHRHSGLRFVSPAQRHAGQDREILAARNALYRQARQANPKRWSGKTRDWSPIGAVTLNPEREGVAAAVDAADAEISRVAA